MAAPEEHRPHDSLPCCPSPCNLQLVSRASSATSPKSLRRHREIGLTLTPETTHQKECAPRGCPKLCVVRPLIVARPCWALRPLDEAMDPHLASRDHQHLLSCYMEVERGFVGLSFWWALLLWLDGTADADLLLLAAPQPLCGLLHISVISSAFSSAEHSPGSQTLTRTHLSPPASASTPLVAYGVISN